MPEDFELVRVVERPEPAVVLEGDFDFAVAPEFNKAVDILLSKQRDFVIDLSLVRFIDSSGLAALLNAYHGASRQGNACRLRGVCSGVRKALQISGCGRAFGIEPLRMDDQPPSQSAEGIPSRAAWQINEAVVVGRPLLVAELRQTAVEAAVEAGLPAKQVDDVKLAVGEALVNAMRHGSRPGKDRIRLRCLACPSVFVVEITDQGDGFDPHGVAAPDHSVLKSGGLGIHLMRSVMDEVEFVQESHGNKVRMLKYIDTEGS